MTRREIIPDGSDDDIHVIDGHLSGYAVGFAAICYTIKLNTRTLLLKLF
ncbi:MAG: hypothetical protein LPH21_18770 [Shewanella sp.]|nr:hypothetical protein [Shewanella sp.]